MTQSWTKQATGRVFLVSAVISAALWGSACGSKKPSAKPTPAGQEAGPDEDRIVLRLGAVSYSALNFRRYVQATIGGTVQQLDATSLSNLFDRFVDDKILLEAAAEHGVTLSLEEKQAFLDKAEAGTWTDEEKASILASDSGPVIDKMKVEKYIKELSRDIAVGEDEVRAYYDGHPDEFSLPERAQVSQILVPTESEAVEVWEKARLSDEEGFRTLARAQSSGPEASDGGQMGVFRRGQLPADMEAAVFGLAEGEVSPIVESAYGFHIFRLDKKLPPEHVPLENAAPAIRQKLLERKSDAAAARRLEELKNSLSWDIFPENLFFPYLRTDQ
jgi:parvulin-like peptidyl-prolyl isomerase